MCKVKAHYKSKCRKGIKLVTVYVLAGLVMISSMCQVFATPEEQYQQTLTERDHLREQMQETNESIQAIESEKKSLQEEYASLQKQVEVYQSEVDAFDEQIELLQEKLDIANQELDDQYEKYCSRVRNIEEYGTTSYWSIIFQASDLQDLLGRLDYVEEIMAYDEQILSNIEARVAALDKQADELNDLRADRNYAAQKLRMLQNELYNKIQQRIKEIEALQQVNAEHLQEINRLTLEGLEIMNRLAGEDYGGTTDPAAIYQKHVVESEQSSITPLGAQIVSMALQYVGDPYVWGGESPEEGFDCSGLMQYVYSQYGYDILRTAGVQYRYCGRTVPFDSLQSGDMVFFQHPDEPGVVAHVGMYIGDGLFVHAASRKSGIKVSDLYSSYYSANYLGAKRIIEEGA